ncbi:MAG: hypothetical protein ACRD4V_02780 [Candidatus Acidiferrales bacterium]
MRKLLLLILLIAASGLSAHAQTFDLYGGRMDISCPNATGHFILEKVGVRWYFCTSLGHAFISMNVAVNARNGLHTWDCFRGPAGTTSGVVWSSSTATYTFASLPSDAIVGNALVTTGFTPSGYNVTNAVITATGVNTVTIAMAANPGTATVLGTGSFDQDASGVYVAKYGSDEFNWSWQEIKRMTSWKFNSIGQDSNVDWYPVRTCSGCVWPGGVQPVPVPVTIELRPMEDASYGYLTGIPIKGVIQGDSLSYTTYLGGELYDVFDPAYSAEANAEFTRSDPYGATLLRANNPWLLGMFSDDSDYFFGSGAGPDFGGHTNANIAYMVMITSPVQTFNPHTTNGAKVFLFANTLNYTKAQATNPVTTCDITNPCSLRDYLWQKYGGSISALDTAWGGATYTSFDSTGVSVTGESLGTGDGTTTTFSGTLAHHPLSPFSVQIEVAGTVVAGDCPWTRNRIPGAYCLTDTTNMGTIGSPTASYMTQSTSTINYSTGAITLNFVTPPASGHAITVNYIYNGWLSGGTGLVDESGGGSAWIGTNNFCLEGADPNYPTYFACTGGSYGTPNANATTGADLDNWESQMSAQYFKVIHDDLRAVSNIPYLGLDTTGSWSTPAYSKFLFGEAPYVDGSFVQLQYSGITPIPTAGQVAYQYETQYMGDVPLLDFITLVAEADSSMSCNAATPAEDFATQTLRGQEYYNTVNSLFNTLSYNGTYQFVGFDWWSWQDFQNSNQGLTSIHDNAYDALEGVAASVTCDATYTSLVNCGSEAADYTGQFAGVNGIVAANSLWLGGTPPPTFPVKPRKKGILWGNKQGFPMLFSTPIALTLKDSNWRGRRTGGTE